jgi:hypothetical protein
MFILIRWALQGAAQPENLDIKLFFTNFFNRSFVWREMKNCVFCNIITEGTLISRNPIPRDRLTMLGGELG